MWRRIIRRTALYQGCFSAKGKHPFCFASASVPCAGTSHLDRCRAALTNRLCRGRDALCRGRGTHPRNVAGHSLQHRYGVFRRRLQPDDGAGCGTGIRNAAHSLRLFLSAMTELTAARRTYDCIMWTLVFLSGPCYNLVTLIR